MATKRQTERLARLLPAGQPRWVRCYDNGFDRYTVVFTGLRWGTWPLLAMSGNPFWPQGVCMREELCYPPDWPRYRHIGKRIAFGDLPADCQRVVLEDYRELWHLEDAGC